MNVELDKEQLLLVYDSLIEFEQRYYNNRDDFWQSVMNDTIAEILRAIGKEQGNEVV